MSLAALIVVLGVVGIIWGISMWMGWLPTVRRTSLLKGGVHPDMVLYGLGMVLIGSTGFISIRALGELGALLILAGAAVWVANPSWLLPGWYKRRYGDQPSGSHPR